MAEKKLLDMVEYRKKHQLVKASDTSLAPQDHLTGQVLVLPEQHREAVKMSKTEKIEAEVPEHLKDKSYVFVSEMGVEYEPRPGSDGDSVKNFLDAVGAFNGQNSVQMAIEGLEQHDYVGFKAYLTPEEFDAWAKERNMEMTWTELLRQSRVIEQPGALTNIEVLNHPLQDASDNVMLLPTRAVSGQEVIQAVVHRLNVKPKQQLDQPSNIIQFPQSAAQVGKPAHEPGWFYIEPDKKAA